MNILVIIEHKDGKMHRMSREAIAGAQKIGGKIIIIALFVDHHRNVCVREKGCLSYKLRKSARENSQVEVRVRACSCGWPLGRAA